MYHRIGDIQTGLGNPNPPKLDNQWTDDNELNEILKSIMEEAIELYFKDYGGLDFKFELNDSKFSLNMGIEPAYKYDKLKIININQDKELSYIQNGRAWGYYGSNVVKETKYYGDYKKQSKFIRFIDKNYEQLDRYLRNKINVNDN